MGSSGLLACASLMGARRGCHVRLPSGAAAERSSQAETHKDRPRGRCERSELEARSGGEALQRQDASFEARLRLRKPQNDRLCELGPPCWLADAGAGKDTAGRKDRGNPAHRPVAGGSGRKHGRALQRRRRVRRPPPDGGPGGEGRLPRSAALAHLWRAPRPGEPRRPGARRARHRARASRRDADARHGRFPGRVLGRDPGRDHPGAAEHASGARPIRLCARGFPRPARRGLGAAAAGRRSRDRRLRAHA